MDDDEGTVSAATAEAARERAQTTPEPDSLILDLTNGDTTPVDPDISREVATNDTRLPPNEAVSTATDESAPPINDGDIPPDDPDISPEVATNDALASPTPDEHEEDGAMGLATGADVHSSGAIDNSLPVELAPACVAVAAPAALATIPWRPRVQAAIVSPELLIAVSFTAAMYLVVLVMRGEDAFVANWWRIALLVFVFGLARALMRADESPDHEPDEVQPVQPPESPGQRIAVVIGASATAITALFQGGNVALQYILSAENERAKIAIEDAKGKHEQALEIQRHKLDEELAKQKHLTEVDDRLMANERELAERALDYLKLALDNESYSHRITLLGFLESIEPPEPNSMASGYYRSMKEWSKGEKTRLEDERDKLLAILDDIVHDCENEKDRCRGTDGKGRRDSILGIVRQVGPESLQPNGRGKRIASIGLPVAFVGENDTLLRAASERTNNEARRRMPVVGLVNADGDGMTQRSGGPVLK